MLYCPGSDLRFLRNLLARSCLIRNNQFFQACHTGRFVDRSTSEFFLGPPASVPLPSTTVVFGSSGIVTRNLARSAIVHAAFE